MDWFREDAIAAGKPTYRRLKLCKLKHISDSYTATGQCIQCVTGGVKKEKPRHIPNEMRQYENEPPSIPSKARGYAKLLGLPRYRATEPCRNGHTSERYTSNGRCVQCVSDRKEKEINELCYGKGYLGR